MNRTFKELTKKGLCLTMAGVLCTGTAVLGTNEYQANAASVKTQEYQSITCSQLIKVNTGTSNRWLKSGSYTYCVNQQVYTHDFGTTPFVSRSFLADYGTNITFRNIVTTDGYTIPTFTAKVTGDLIQIDISDKALGISASDKTSYANEVQFYSNYDVFRYNALVKSCKYSYTDADGHLVTKSEEFNRYTFRDKLNLNCRPNTEIKVWDIVLNNGYTIPDTFTYTTNNSDGSFMIDIQDYVKTSKVIFSFDSENGLTASGQIRYVLDEKTYTKTFSNTNEFEIMCDAISEIEIVYLNIPGKGSVTDDFVPISVGVGTKTADIDLDTLEYIPEEAEVTATPVATTEPTATPEVTTTPVATTEPTATPEVTETPVATTEPTATPEVTETPVATTEPTATPEPTNSAADIPDNNIPSGPVENNQVLTISSKKVNLKVGEKYTLTAASTNGDVIYKTSNSAIATIDKNGNIIAKKAGNVTVTVTSGDLEKKCAVSVAKTPTTATTKLNVTKKTLKKGKSFVIKVRFSNGTSDKKITYKTSSKKIATVSKTGKITAKKAGKCKITILTSNGIKKTVRVTVK